MKLSSGWIVALIVSAGGAVSIALLPRIPVYRTIIPWLLPATAIAVYLILCAVSRRSSGQRRHEAVVAIAVNAVIFVICLHVLMVSNLADVAWARALGPRSVIVLLGGAIVTAGNLLPRTGPNLAVGLRTRRMVANPDLWSRMHRIGGYAAVILGCAVAAAGLFLPGPAIGGAISVFAMVTITSLGITYWRLTHD